MTSSLKLSCVVARDVDRLRDFYANALGMPVRFQDGAKWCQLDAGRADFSISNQEEAAPLPGGTFAVFQVKSLVDATAQVAAAGGQIVHRRDMGAHGAVVTCRDIEENYFQLFATAASGLENKIKEAS